MFILTTERCCREKIRCAQRAFAIKDSVVLAVVCPVLALLKRH